MRRINIIALVSISTLIQGCASTPHGSINYYFPKATTTFVITQTLSCNAKGDQLHEVVTVTPTTAYSSDLSVSPASIMPRDLDATTADADIGFSFTDDGRLSGVNTSTTGQGGAIVKGVVSIATAAGLAAASAGVGVYDAKKACSVISGYSAKSAGAKAAGADSTSPPTVTLTYTDSFQYGTAPSPADPTKVSLQIASPPGQPAAKSNKIPPDSSSVDLFKLLVQDIPKLGFTALIEDTSQKFAAPIWDGASAADGLLITLNRVALANIVVKGSVGDLQDVNTVWSGQVPVPLTDKDDLYNLPIPKAAFFGSQKFTLNLSQYGSIEKLEYATTGASDAADAVSAVGGAIAGALKSPTEAQQASDVQAKADLIYQQQRLAACTADPKTCASK